MDDDKEKKPQPQQNEPDPNSKSQKRKRRRMENAKLRWEQKKKLKKEAKIAKAKSEGRDLDAERRGIAERTARGEGFKKNKMEGIYKKKREQAEKAFKVCLDCNWNDQMTFKELSSLAKQIRFCYAKNRITDTSVNFSVSGLSGTVQEVLSRVEGRDKWSERGTTCSEEDLINVHPDKSKLIYLTSDSNNVLETLENDKVYVIGGIVDRNRLKRATITRAEELGIATAKLPLEEHLKLTSTKVLTCNHVFEILLKYREFGDWKKSLLEVLPSRKDVKAIEEADKTLPALQSGLKVDSSDNADNE